MNSVVLYRKDDTRLVMDHLQWDKHNNIFTVVKKQLELPSSIYAFSTWADKISLLNGIYVFTDSVELYLTIVDPHVLQLEGVVPYTFVSISRTDFSRNIQTYQLGMCSGELYLAVASIYRPERTRENRSFFELYRFNRDSSTFVKISHMETLVPLVDDIRMSDNTSSVLPNLIVLADNELYSVDFMSEPSRFSKYQPAPNEIQTAIISLDGFATVKHATRVNTLCYPSGLVYRSQHECVFEVGTDGMKTSALGIEGAVDYALTNGNTGVFFIETTGLTDASTLPGRRTTTHLGSFLDGKLKDWSENWGKYGSNVLTSFDFSPAEPKMDLQCTLENARPFVGVHTIMEKNGRTISAESMSVCIEGAHVPPTPKPVPQGIRIGSIFIGILFVGLCLAVAWYCSNKSKGGGTKYQRLHNGL